MAYPAHRDAEMTWAWRCPWQWRKRPCWSWKQLRNSLKERDNHNSTLLPPWAQLEVDGPCFLRVQAVPSNVPVSGKKRREQGAGKPGRRCSPGREPGPGARQAGAEQASQTLGLGKLERVHFSSEHSHLRNSGVEGLHPSMICSHCEHRRVRRVPF